MVVHIWKNQQRLKCGIALWLVRRADCRPIDAPPVRLSMLHGRVTGSRSTSSIGSQHHDLIEHGPV
jgi:hypothetical protein